MTPTPYLYPAYRPSGVPWLGEVPEHWAVERLSTSVESQINGVWGSDPDGTDDLPCIRVADFDRRKHRIRTDNLTLRSVKRSERSGRILRKGDLLLEKSGGGEQQPVGTVMLYDHDFQAVCSNFVGRMVLREGYDPTYQTYLHATLYAIGVNKKSIKQTTGIQNIDASSYLSELVGVPPLTEQAAIVRYLDHVDRRIRRYVTAERKLIALLEEERQAVINQAVTRGLDSNVPLKPSGVEWLGDVPEHWAVERLSTSVESQINGVWGSDPDGTDDLPCIRVADFDRRNHRIRTDKLTLRSVKPSEQSGRILRKGDLLLEKSGGGEQQPVGTVMLYDHDFQAVCSNFVGRMVLRESYDPTYQTYLHATLYAIGVNKRSIKQTTGIQNIDASGYLSELVGVPPLHEQAAIVEHLDKATAGIDATFARARRQIELLQEYRTRLVADVVTGKLDVREAAAQLPDEADDQDPIEENGPLADGLDEVPYDIDESVEELAIESEVTV